VLQLMKQLELAGARLAAEVCTGAQWTGKVAGLSRASNQAAVRLLVAKVAAVLRVQGVGFGRPGAPLSS